MTNTIDPVRERVNFVPLNLPAQEGRLTKIVNRCFEALSVTADLRGVTANTMSAVPTTAPIAAALAGLTVAGGAMILMIGPRMLYAAVKTKQVALAALGAAFTALGGVITKIGVDKIHNVASPIAVTMAFTVLGFIVYGILTLMATIHLYKSVQNYVQDQTFENKKEVLKQVLLIATGLFGVAAMSAMTCGAGAVIPAVLFAVSSLLFLGTDSSFIFNRLANLTRTHSELLALKNQSSRGLLMLDEPGQIEEKEGLFEN